jgi:exodeoxyribonuclease V alpha subunit
VIRLTEVFRQAGESRIVRNAHRMNAGQLPEPAPQGAPSDFFFVEVDDPVQAAQRLLHIVSERIPARFGLDAVRDVQVLCPMNRGALGAQALNLELQKQLNPAREPRLERFGWTYCVGDKVMQIENDYDKDVYNGDLGFIARIDPQHGVVTVDIEGRHVSYEAGDLDQLVLAYATTIHKAQGSEYPAVVIPVSTQHYPMLQRNLLYTAVTRGRRLVVLVGQRKAVAIAVSAGQVRRRWSRLKEWMAGWERMS